MVLLTGANGLVGSFVARMFLNQNIPFKILLRKNSNRQLIDDILDKLQIIEGDILDIPSLQIAIQDCTKVVHCAAIIAYGDVSEQKMLDVNVEGTKNIVNLCLELKIHRLIYLSSIAAIGRTVQSKLIDENTKWVEDESNSLYAKSKYLAELEVWRGVNEGLTAIILCPSIILGPGNWNQGSTKIFRNINEGMLFYPTGSTNVVDVRDVAKAVHISLDCKETNERYILNANTILFYDFFSLISKGFGKNPPRFKITEKIIVPFYYILKILAPFYLSKRYINRETIRIASSHYRYSNEKFVNAFNFKYLDVNESIKWTCEGLMERYLK
ncbi:MAG: NAD-dependent epimerase/dehydratase family protein [Bacteroidota bacterium]|nr:NAD-dependent epimerase/dehydratase family protein [Bacteroidota bacterium]